MSKRPIKGHWLHSAPEADNCMGSDPIKFPTFNRWEMLAVALFCAGLFGIVAWSLIQLN